MWRGPDGVLSRLRPLCAASAIILSLDILPRVVLAQSSDVLDINVSKVFESPLPAFYFLEGASEGSLPRVWGVAEVIPQGDEADWDDSCGDDIFTSPQSDMRDHILPHTLQNRWSGTPKESRVNAVKLENAKLSVMLTPQWGGKVQSIQHRSTGAPLVFENSAHIPINGGVRKAWSSGGIEWNWGGGRGQIGHSVFTEDPAFVARVADPWGEHVRIYEFDRFNGTLWQVDLLLPNTTEAAMNAFWMHVKVSNPTATSKRGYWWTNTAVKTSNAGRVLSPASLVAESGVCGLSCAPWPMYSDECAMVSDSGENHLNRSAGHVYDHSIVGNLGAGRDGFLRAYQGPRLPGQGLYVAHVDRDVYGRAVGSLHGVYGSVPVESFGTAPNGTKFFAWPNSRQGQFWQDFLSGTSDDSRRGNYIELQIGVAPMQMQTFAMPAHAGVEWTEYIMAMEGSDVNLLHGRSYTGALAELHRWLNTSQGMPTRVISNMHDHMKEIARRPIVEADILAAGTPWGALEEKRRGMRLSTTDVFTFEGWEQEEPVRPWYELLVHGRFSQATLDRAYPQSFQIDPAWVAILRASAAQHGQTWLHALLEGVAEAEYEGGEGQASPDFSKSRELFSQSLALRPNPVASRCLAVTAPVAAEAESYFLQAWRLSVSAASDDTRLLVPLANEIVSFYLQLQRTAAWDDALARFLSELPTSPPEVRGADGVLYASAVAALRRGDTAAVRGILQSSQFPTFFASQRTALASLWGAAAYLDEEVRLQRPLTSVERRRLRGQVGIIPPPDIGPFDSSRQTFATFKKQRPLASCFLTLPGESSQTEAAEFGNHFV